MPTEDGGDNASKISGGNQYGPVVQGRDFTNTTFVSQQAGAAPVARAQLPGLVAGFSGRDAELAQVSGLLDPGGDAGPVVVSAMAGLAGVGKTALAIHAAHAARTRGWFPGGVLFIDLHGYDAPVQPGQALDALLRALGIPAEHIPPGTDERAALYRSLLAQVADPVLIVADNASAEGQVRLLLPGPGPHKVLVTSRHTLAGLGARLLDVSILDEDAAIALLDGLLRSARPDDDRITAAGQAAGELAGFCGGLPLALQITAALMVADPDLTASELAAQLASEIGRLEALDYDGSRMSVTAAFELSYRALDDQAARMFRLLPVSPGPDISTAATAVVAGLPEAEARRVLGRLSRAHLAETTGGRWRMHDLLRLYARQLSDTSAAADDRDQATTRLLDYYTAKTRAADAHLRALRDTVVPPDFTGREDALGWLDAERPTLIAAIALAARTSQGPTATALALNMAEYLQWRRRFDEAMTVYQDAAAIYRDTGDRRGEGAALNNLGNALQEVRRFDEAITAHQDAAAIFRQTGDRHHEGMALDNLGAVLHEVRRFDEAITAHQDAAAIFRKTGDLHSEVMELNNLGNALQEVRRFDEAITALEQDLAICRETGDRHGEGITLNNLGNALQQLRRFDEAITAHQDAAAIFRDTGDRHGEGGALNNLGLALREVRRFGEAITACRDAAAIFRDTGDRRSEGIAVANLEAAQTEAQSQ